MLLKRPVEDNVRKEEEEVIKLLPPEVYDIFKEKFAFKTFTPVQFSFSLIRLTTVLYDRYRGFPTMRKSSDHRWGDYYMSGGRNTKKSWWLEVVRTVNEMIPTFNELFDEETFYVFAFFVVVCSILLAFFLSKVIGLQIKEYPLNVDREWRDARPANPFHFPWNDNNNNNEK